MSQLQPHSERFKFSRKSENKVHEGINFFGEKIGNTISVSFDPRSGSKLFAKLNMQQMTLADKQYHRHTVNSEIFARILFSQNFAYARFCENKTIAKWRDHSAIY